MRIVFFGSPEFAVKPLLALIEAGHEIAAVVTQPDRPKGRGERFAMTPVKEAALSLGLPVSQPPKINDPQAVEEIKGFRGDIFVVVAFGQILKQELLTCTKYGAVNLHGSLLPAYRGAAPIHWALINGEKRTGVTTMFMNAGMDTGNMIFKEEIELLPDDNTGLVYEKLSQIGAGLLCRTLDAISSGSAPSIPQDESLATYAPLLKKEHELIDWSQTAQKIHDRIRGLVPWPVAYTMLDGRRLKIWESKLIDEDKQFAASCGQVLKLIQGEGVLVQTGGGALLLVTVQPEGKAKMPAIDWARGSRITAGLSLGE